MNNVPLISYKVSHQVLFILLTIGGRIFFATLELQNGHLKTLPTAYSPRFSLSLRSQSSSLGSPRSHSSLVALLPHLTHS